jgi:DNA-directed RNA polymerase subunit RPC12/RpoP
MNALAQSLRAAGFLPGVSYHVEPSTIRADARIARATRCPACSYRGLTLNPFHRGEVYRAIGRCDRCKHEVEL